MIFLGAVLICGGFFGLGIFFVRWYDERQERKSQAAYDEYVAKREVPEYDTGDDY